MLNYKFHAVTKSGDRTDGRDIQCKDDAAALDLAEELLPGYAWIEVCLEAKLVGLASTPGHQQGPATATDCSIATNVSRSVD